MAEKPPASPSSAVNESNIVPITLDKLTPEQQKDLEAMMQQARNQFLNSFMETRKGTIVQKYKVRPRIEKYSRFQMVQLNQVIKVLRMVFKGFKVMALKGFKVLVLKEFKVMVLRDFKSMVDGSIAEYQAIGPVYLPGGVFPNYRPLITNNQSAVQPIPPNAPSAQPVAPVSAPAPAAPSSTPGQLINPRLLVREQPQHSEQNVSRLTQDEGAAMFLPPQPTVDAVQQQPIQQTPPTQQVVRPIQQTPRRQQVVQPIQRQGLMNTSAGFVTPDNQLRQHAANQVVPEHLVHNVQPDQTVVPQVFPENLKVTLHEQRFAEARKNFKKVNHVFPYIYGLDDDDDDSEIAVAEWVRSKKVIPCQWVKSSGKEERYDFDITKADKIFDLLLREKQIQLPAGHTIPSAQELGKRRYCKWHNSGSHSTNDCKVFRQQIHAAIEGGKIKIDDSKRLMKVDGSPFPVNMVHTAGQTADGGRAGGFQVNSAKIINKYQKKYDEQQGRHYGEDDGGFDPYWDCEFFRFCWNEGMRLPSIEDCPGCSNVIENSSRSYNRSNRLRQARVPVHQRLGPVNQGCDQEDNKDGKTQWCPSGIFTKNQKRRVQRLRNRERFQEVEQEINHRLKKEKPKQEWRVKNQVPAADEATADEAKRLAKGKGVVTASNMVFTLPAEFGVKQADVDKVEEESAKLILSPEQAVFEKPEGAKNRHLKPLYINGYVNGKPMSKMMVDGRAAVNLMPYAIFRKLGRNAEDLI
uniref:Retrotransposon protein, putative, unclassified n=1 Tax=Oryza sativa subsp. japonica TaxID=39947 RepID=Q2R8L0_ORYSJ|nr:retrotransposon protein, putative, unclassified [Oryza sativa Japonica Group]